MHCRRFTNIIFLQNPAFFSLLLATCEWHDAVRLAGLPSRLCQAAPSRVLVHTCVWGPINRAFMFNLSNQLAVSKLHKWLLLI